MKILIDNGHGEETRGKRSPDGRFREYKFARDIAQLIVRKLVLKGYDAERIVTEENDVPLSERVRRVNNYCNRLGRNNVMLISIHVNASGNGSSWMTARGWSAFTSKGVTRSDAIATCLCQAAHKYLEGISVREDWSDGDPDWEEDFYILLRTLCPAVLTENLFQDNEQDVEYLESVEGREAIVNLHVEGIINYITQQQ
jgi:N-acetylmuramoyl-L-alanine amidase